MGELTYTVKGPVASFRSADKANIESLKLHFLPKQEGSGDPSPSNIRPITGWTGCNLTHCGVNCWDEQWEAGGWDPNTGESFDAGHSYIRSKNFIKIASPGTYRTTKKLLFLCYDENKQYLNLYIWSNTTTGMVYFSNTRIKYVRFMTNASYGRTYNNDISLSYFFANASYAQYSGETIPISWSDHDEIYGGYVDLIRGKIVCEWGKIKFKSSYFESASIRVTENYSFVTRSGWLPRSIDSNKNIISDQFSKIDSTDNAEQWKMFITSMGWLRLYGPASLNSIEAWDEYFSNQYPEFVYKFAVPIEYDISAVQSKTFLDYNNFWSDMNDDTEVEYCFADRLSKRKLIMNEPHIAIPTPAPIVSFHTDMVAPMPKLVANFLPKQEGSGDASPTNIRSITGWTGCEVYKSNKNILNLLVPVSENPLNAGTYCIGKSYPPSRNIWADGSEAVTNIVITSDSINFTNNSSTTAYGIGYSIATAPNISYSFNYTATNGKVVIQEWDKDKQYIDTLSSSTGTTCCFTTGSSVKYLYICFIPTTKHANVSFTNIQLEINSESTNHENYNGETIPISWSSNGTLYGGYADLVNGEVWKTTNLLHFQPNYIQGVIQNTFGGNAAYLALSARIGNIKKSQPIVCSDKLKPAQNEQYDIFSAYVLSEERLVIGLPQELNTLQLVQDWMTDIGGFDVVYLISNPTLFATTSLNQFKTYKGTNNIWSNLNGNIEVEYWSH